MHLRIIPDNTKLPFMRWVRIRTPVSLVLVVASFVLLFTVGVNVGIDFVGGTVIEAESLEGPADVAAIRSTVEELGLGEVQVQTIGDDRTVLIRIAVQPGGDGAQQQAVATVRDALGIVTSQEADAAEAETPAVEDAAAPEVEAAADPEVEAGNYVQRRVEVVGPRVSGELARTGTLAVLFTIGGIMAYIWLRFEWQFAIGAVATLVHDAILTVGFFAATQIDFSLSSIAAILTIIGYSLNDTVVIFDRIREVLRKYKQMPISEVIDLATNQTLARTIMTSLTLLVALGALYVFGGPVIRSFTAAMIWGVFVATASSIFIGGPVLIYFNIRPAPSAAGSASPTSAKG